MPLQPDVIVVGAGAAGLVSALRLARAGLKVLILEARNRVGGRMFTQQDPACHAPVELGAEFVHGRPPEICDLLQKYGGQAKEVEGDYWCCDQRGLRPCDFFGEVDSLLQKMDDNGPDLSFADFLERCFPKRKGDAKYQEAKRRALGYITGFHAADPRLISVHSLVAGMRAEEQIEGDRAFRIVSGYGWLVQMLCREAEALGVAIELRCVAEVIRWSGASGAKVEIKARTQNGSVQFIAPRVLVTLPLGVLQAKWGESGAVKFIPDLPREKQSALAKLLMGKASRLVLRFRERFWDHLWPAGSPGQRTLSNLSFLFSHEAPFPTWWTTMPEKLPLITAWSPAGCAEDLAGHPQTEVTAKALQVLASLLGQNATGIGQWFEASYWHDWHSDPFARGAYSYVGVGGDNAQRQLAAPVEGKLFFAGEATDFTGHHGTVHGALASGHRAAEEILASRRNSRETAL